MEMIALLLLWAFVVFMGTFEAEIWSAADWARWSSPPEADEMACGDPKVGAGGWAMDAERPWFPAGDQEAG